MNRGRIFFVTSLPVNNKSLTTEDIQESYKIMKDISDELKTLNFKIEAWVLQQGGWKRALRLIDKYAPEELKNALVGYEPNPSLIEEYIKEKYHGKR